MKAESLFYAVLMCLLAGILCNCYSKISSYSFETSSHSECNQGAYIKGFEVKINVRGIDIKDMDELMISILFPGAGIYGPNLMQERKQEREDLVFHCCPPPALGFLPRNQVVYADWNSKLDDTNRFVECPSGYFLQGLYKSASYYGLISNIENGRCSRPENHPNYYGDCYNQDIGECLKQKSLCKCKDDYYVVGLHKPNCDAYHCINVLRCCKMAEKPEDVDELSNVKTYVMQTTMVDIANLAHYLGYSYCLGCRGLNIGEGFIRYDDTWRADQSRGCEGEKNDERLVMVYGDWGFLLKDVKYGEPLLEEMKPETIDSGTIYNSHETDVKKRIERTETSVRSVKHTTTSSWKQGHELGLEIKYQPLAGLDITGSYKFSYESSQSTKDETGQEQTKTLTVNTEKTLKPNTAAKWSLIMSKTRTTVHYTASVKMKFSVELQGFLRQNDGGNNHYVYKGNGNRPTFNYKYGNQTVPFYTALKRDAATSNVPWLWNDIKFYYPEATKRISDLTKESHYEFNLTGKFEDVIGTHIYDHWEPVPLNNTPPVKFSL